MRGNLRGQLHMERKSRTQYSARNTMVAVCARVVAILLGFCTRVVFTRTLSQDYVGVNGLFTDILNVLSLSELGISTAITYALYQPIAEGDIERQKSLMRLYKQFYRIVAGVVLVAGLLVLPFMDVLIKNKPDVEYLTFLYLMYLTNSVISYLLIYKRTLIEAYQLSYIGVVCQTVFLIVQNVVQMVVLLTTRNFVLFVIILLLCTLLNNVAISMIADRMYPFLKEKEVQELEQSQKQEIFKNIRAMLMHKVGTVIVNNTDNLLLSSLVGITSVGIYSNYFLVIGSVRQVLNQAFQGITASVGNLGVEEEKEHVRDVFEASFFVNQWLFGVAAICLYELLTPFVGFSFGEHYVFDKKITLVLCLNFFFTGMRQATLAFRDSLGLFWYDRYKSLAEAFVNLVVSVVLGCRYGVLGIFLGTLISTITTSLWIEPYVLYKYRLKASVSSYFGKYVKYLAGLLAAWGVTDWLCAKTTKFVGGILVCLIIPNVVLLIFYMRNKELHFLIQKFGRLFRKSFCKSAGTEPVEEKMTAEQDALLYMLRCALTEEKATAELEQGQWEELAVIAKRHSVLSVLYDEIVSQNNVPENVIKMTEVISRQMVLQQYHLLFLTKQIITLLEENGIEAAVLKGQAAGAYYPVPELRKSGDVDLLLTNADDLEKAKNVLTDAGFGERTQQQALHHFVFLNEDGIEIEIHTMLAEPFDNARTNCILAEVTRDMQGALVTADVMGVKLPVLPKAYFGFELLLHMLQHFLRAGFGLKLLCDWTVFWKCEYEEDEKQKYLQLVELIGIKKFSDMITDICVTYLGLPEEKVSWMKLSKDCPTKEVLRDIFEAEEFGRSSAKRMVTLRGDGLIDYIREFHHQTCLNFPNAQKYFVVWPVLWVITLVRFLRNNRSVRNESTLEIVRKTHAKSKYMKNLELFQKR